VYIHLQTYYWCVCCSVCCSAWCWVSVRLRCMYEVCVWSVCKKWTYTYLLNISVSVRVKCTYIDRHTINVCVAVRVAVRVAVCVAVRGVGPVYVWSVRTFTDILDSYFGKCTCEVCIYLETYYWCVCCSVCCSAWCCVSVRLRCMYEVCVWSVHISRDTLLMCVLQCVLQCVVLSQCVFEVYVLSVYMKCTCEVCIHLETYWVAMLMRVSMCVAVCVAVCVAACCGVCAYIRDVWSVHIHLVTYWVAMLMCVSMCVAVRGAESVCVWSVCMKCMYEVHVWSVHTSTDTLGSYTDVCVNVCCSACCSVCRGVFCHVWINKCRYEVYIHLQIYLAAISEYVCPFMWQCGVHTLPF